MPKILLVEDSVPLREIIRQSLTDHGHTVFEAENGRKAITMIGQHEPDLMITDLVMPEFDGMELLMAVGRAKPGLPVIAISGTALHLELLLKTAGHLGAARALAKPFTPTQLLDAIKEVLGNNNRAAHAD
jgi:CheY-like chemotaxis protein